MIVYQVGSMTVNQSAPTLGATSAIGRRYPGREMKDTHKARPSDQLSEKSWTFTSSYGAVLR